MQIVHCHCLCFHAMAFNTGDIIQENILRHFYITPTSSKILNTKYPLRSTFNRKLWRHPLQVRRQTQSCTISPRPVAYLLPLARSTASTSCLNRTVISSLTTLWYIFKLLCNCWQILDVFERFLKNNSPK